MADDVAVTGGWISDPVHNYVEFTSIERVILDHRVTQRLRYISQTGLVHLVFPEVRTSRFSHCLGAMHLASDFLRACLQNSVAKNRLQLGRALTSAAEHYGGGVSGVSGPQDDETSRILQAHLFCPTDEGIQPQAIIAAEQAVRLAALFHDLGHLPFSHDFEHALDWRRSQLDTDHHIKEVINDLLKPPAGSNKVAIHEKVGHQLARFLLRDLTSEPTRSDSMYVNNVFSFAFKILTLSDISVEEPESQTDAEKAVVFLHSLVSGELDVDRSDYLLRDGRNYGFEFAEYNLNRLLTNLVVAIRREGDMVLAVRPQGLSSVESFLLSRSRSYQFGVRHHKVTQVGAALQYLIGQIVQESRGIEGRGTVHQFMRDLAIISENADKDPLPNTQTQRNLETDILDRFAEYDDIWWTVIMRQRLLKLPSLLQDLGRDSRRSEDYVKLKDEAEWLSLVRWRGRGPRSLWKRPADFADHLRNAGFQGDGLAPIRTWNERLAGMDESGNEQPWVNAVAELANGGVLVIRHHFNPWSVDDRAQSRGLYVQVDGDNLMAVSALSPLATALPDAWMNDVQVHAFASTEARTKWDARRVIERLLAAMTEASSIADVQSDAEQDVTASSSQVGGDQ